MSGAFDVPEPGRAERRSLLQRVLDWLLHRRIVVDGALPLLAPPDATRARAEIDRWVQRLARAQGLDAARELRSTGGSSGSPARKGWTRRRRTPSSG